MNIAALILAIAAFVAFLAEYEQGPHRSRVPFGLALLTGAIILQFVWQAHWVTTH